LDLVPVFHLIGFKLALSIEYDIVTVFESPLLLTAWAIKYLMSECVVAALEAIGAND
jgi:hypothetical protein